MKLNQFLNFIKNIKYYYKFLRDDDDTDYNFVNKILVLKLKKIYNHWGINTDYVGDYNDRELLLKYINELEAVICVIEVLDFDNNKEEEEFYEDKLSKIYNNIGKILPKFWN
jgi:hypothetical protein